jgi:hypothetical protein
MDGLTSTIQRCNIQLKLDNRTEGYGDCFPNAIVQQCRRPEIRGWLQQNRPWAIINSQQTLRTKISNYSLKSRHKTITDLKIKHAQVLQPVENQSWTEYWNQMAQEGTWVDHLFVQVTAWYLGLDILILTTSATPENPFLLINGNNSNTAASTSGPPLLIGNYTNVHYQSLLPENLNVQQKQKENCEFIATEAQDAKDSNEKTRSDDFIYIHNGDQIFFHNLIAVPFLQQSLSSTCQPYFQPKM